MASCTLFFCSYGLRKAYVADAIPCDDRSQHPEDGLPYRTERMPSKSCEICSMLS